MDLEPVTLRGRWITLEPLAERHAADLFAVMRDEEVCRYLTWAPPAAPADTLALVRDAEALMAAQEAIARLGAVREGVLRGPHSLTPLPAVQHHSGHAAPPRREEPECHA